MAQIILNQKNFGTACARIYIIYVLFRAVFLALENFVNRFDSVVSIYDTWINFYPTLTMIDILKSPFTLLSFLQFPHPFLDLFIFPFICYCGGYLFARFYNQPSGWPYFINYK